MKRNFLTVVALLYLCVGGAIYALWMYMPAFHLKSLLIGNTLMALLSVSAYLMIRKEIGGRPQAFARGVYGASLLKLMTCMAGILVYVLVSRPNVHKPTVFVLMGIYAIYTVAETILLSKMARGVTNEKAGNVN